MGSSLISTYTPSSLRPVHHQHGQHGCLPRSANWARQGEHPCCSHPGGQSSIVIAQVGLVQYQDPGCAHAEQSLELRHQPASAGSSSTNPMGGYFIPYPVPPSLDSLETSSNNIKLDRMELAQMEQDIVCSFKCLDCLVVDPVASAVPVGSILSDVLGDVATLEHPSQTSDLKWNNFTYTSTPPGNNILYPSPLCSSAH
jgi:hypothetical protein